jgi:hypothetical protein
MLVEAYPSGPGSTNVMHLQKEHGIANSGQWTTTK